MTAWALAAGESENNVSMITFVRSSEMHEIKHSVLKLQRRKKDVAC